MPPPPPEPRRDVYIFIFVCFGLTYNYAECFPCARVYVFARLYVQVCVVSRVWIPLGFVGCAVCSCGRLFFSHERTKNIGMSARKGGCYPCYIAPLAFGYRVQVLIGTGAIGEYP